MVKISMKLFIAMATAACVGLSLACAFLIFNIKHRSNRYIKMSSPHLNNLIIIGSMMCYACVFLLGSAAFLDKTHVEIYKWTCVIHMWLMSCGFTLGFGTMFVKTWRVYKIFTNTKLNKQLDYLHDRHLVFLLVVFLGVDVVILSVWQIVDPLQANMDGTFNQKNRDNRKVFIYSLLSCSCAHHTAWIASLYACKGFLLLFGVFLAWETRNVTYRALNDSRYIGMSVYNVVIWACIAVPLNEWVTIRDLNAAFGLVASAITICTTSTLLLVFGPKVRTVKVKTEPNSPSRDNHTPTEQNMQTKQHPTCPGCKCDN